MAPVIPFIPLIAAGIGAAGGIATSIIGKKSGGASAPKAATVSPLATEEDKGNKNGVIPLSTSPLGDTTNPNLQRGKLLGN